jgi:hypothetical protein
VLIRPLKILFRDLFSRESNKVLAGSFEVTAQELFTCLSYDYRMRTAKKRSPLLPLEREFTPLRLDAALDSGASESSAGASRATSNRTHQPDRASNPASDVDTSGTEGNMPGDAEIIAARLAGEGVIEKKHTRGSATEPRSSYERLITTTKKWGTK